MTIRNLNVTDETRQRLAARALQRELAEIRFRSELLARQSRRLRVMSNVLTFVSAAILTLALVLLILIRDGRVGA